MANLLWDQLLDLDTLRRGWHLARRDNRRAFIEDVYCFDAFASDLDGNLKEIRNRLIERRYRPSPLTHIEIPKSSYAVRPGACMQVADCVVAHAIIYLIAPIIDPSIHKNVYSYRLKKDYKSSEELFEESDISNLPYLKSKFVAQHIDPFEAWYENWPKFDAFSKASFLKHGHKFLAVSDISAYFENIQIPILRDQLLQLLADESRIVNLLVSFLEAWAVKTIDGRSQWRGIPQGNSVSSFLGNIFLMPVDDAFQEFCEKHDAEYFRYMDDVRIFTKVEGDARQAILLLDRALKSRHLNVQSAKTKIRKEDNKEISNELIDDRLTLLEDVIKDIDTPNLTNADKNKLLKRLKHLTTINPRPGSQKLSGKRSPLQDSLDSRFFRRWSSAHLKLGSTKHVDRLLYEITNNPDPRLSSLVLRTIKVFPKQNAFSLKLLDFIRSPLNTFPQQEAELIRAFRYLSEVPTEIINHCKDRAFSTSVDFYVRMQALHLLSRVDLSVKDYKQLYTMFPEELDENVQAAMAGNLVKYRDKHGDVLKTLVLHPNDKVRQIGKYFRKIKWDLPTSTAKVDFLFKDGLISYRLCDNMPLLCLLSYMRTPEQKPLRAKLVSLLKVARNTAERKGHRETLQNIYKFMTEPEETPSNDNDQLNLLGITEVTPEDDLGKILGDEI